MSNVVQFKSAKELEIEGFSNINLYDLFSILSENREYGKITVLAENCLGDVEVISSGLDDFMELLERFYCQNRIF